MDGGGDSDSESSERAPAVVAGKDAPDPDDFDAVPAEVERFGKKQANKIPHERVKAMIAKRENAVITEVAKALGITKAAAELKLDDVLGHVGETSKKYKGYDERFATVSAIEDIMANDEDRFVRMMAQAEAARAQESGQPSRGKYQRLVDFIDGKHAAPAEAAKPAAVDHGADPEPEPDYPLRDAAGQVIGYTHSVESQKKHNEWKDRQYDKKFQAALAEKFGPIEKAEKEKAEKERQRLRGIELRKGAEEKIAKQWDRAMQKWPQFAENEKAIQDYIEANGCQVHDAYIEVVIPKLHMDNNKALETVIAETNAKPRRTSAATSTAAAKPAAAAEKSTADFAREAMKEAGL